MTPLTVFGADEAPAGYVDVALAAAGMAPWRYTLDERTCVFGARAQALYGVGSPYLVDEVNVRALLHPDDVEPMWQAVAAAADPAGDGRYFAEYRVRRPEGGWRWLSVWGLVEFESEASPGWWRSRPMGGWWPRCCFSTTKDGCAMPPHRACRPTTWRPSTG